MFVLKSLKSALASKQAQKEGGDKVTKIGARRRSILRQIIADGLSSGKSVDSIAAKLRREAASQNDKKRDWKRVARTEMTDAAARASADLLEDLHGREAWVYRNTSNCCDQCAKLFGKPGKPKLWKLSDVPDRLRGAVHPNCKCSPWISTETPELFKSMPYPVGVVKRSKEDWGYDYKISSGTGKWFSLHSVTGKSVIRHILMRTPLVLIERYDGKYLFRHGHGKPSIKQLILVDPRKVVCTYHQYDPFNEHGVTGQRKRRAMSAKTWDEYIEAVLKVFPAVIAMPEYWSYGEGLRHASDFMGYKTLTDWYVLANSIPKGAIIFSKRQGIESRRAVIRREAKKMIRSDDIRKQ